MIENFKIGQGINKKLLLTRIVERERKRVDDNFFELHFRDASGRIEGREWNKNAINNVDEGEVVRVRGEIVEYKNSPQIQIASLRPSEGDVADFVESVVGNPEAYFQRLKETVSDFGDSHLKRGMIDLLSHNKDKLKKWPAALGKHHAKVGGLIKHMYSMEQMAGQLIEHYHNLYDEKVFDEDLVKAGIILHDFWKTETLDSPYSARYNEKGNKLGHIALAMEHIPSHFGDYEKVDELKHVVLSHHGKKEWGSPVEPRTPEAKLVHRLDMMDSRMDKLFGREDD